MTARVEGSTYPQTPAVSEGRRQNAMVHGARSEPRVRDVAKNQKRALLRKLNRRARDLDLVSAVLVDLLARSLAKLQLLDAHFAEHGILREDGEPASALTNYWTAHNAARLTAGRLAEHLARQGDHGGETLEQYVIANYSRPVNGDNGADE